MSWHIYLEALNGENVVNYATVHYIEYIKRCAVETPGEW